MGDCIVRLNQLIDQLSPAEARVARYLLDHCQEAIGQPHRKGVGSLPDQQNHGC